MTFQTPQENVEAGYRAWAEAKSWVDRWEAAYREWVQKKVDFEKKYTEAYQFYRDGGQSVKDAERNADQDAIIHFKDMIEAEGEVKKCKMVIDLYMAGVSFSQTSANVLIKEAQLELKPPRGVGDG